MAHVNTKPIPTLIERLNAAWAKCNIAWDKDKLAPTKDVNRLTSIRADLDLAKPATLAEFFAKWRLLCEYENELGDPAHRIVPEAMTTMLGELQPLISKQ